MFQILFDCPVCGRKHVVNDNYDNNDTICLNTTNAPNQKTFQDMTPNTILSRTAFNFNRSSTKTDVARAATIIVKGPNYRPTGEKIGQLKKNY